MTYIVLKAPLNSNQPTLKVLLNPKQSTIQPSRFNVSRGWRYFEI